MQSLSVSAGRGVGHSTITSIPAIPFPIPRSPPRFSSLPFTNDPNQQAGLSVPFTEAEEQSLG